MFKSSKLTKSFLHVFPDKENNPGSQNLPPIPTRAKRASIDIPEKLPKAQAKDLPRPRNNRKEEGLCRDFKEKLRIEEAMKTEGSESCEEREASYREIENRRLSEVYSRDILEFLRKSELRNNNRGSLENHKIPANLRAKMVDWMVEVLSSYKCQDETFFVSVALMDSYFKHCRKPLEITDLHLTGVTCMFIANKYEEIYPLKLATIHEKIAHRKLSLEQIKSKEQDVLDTLDYNLNIATPYDFMTLALNSLGLSGVIPPKSIDYLKKVALYLLKMMMHDYGLLFKQNYHELAAATIFVAFKIIEQLDSGFPVEEKAKEVRDILEVKDEVFYETSSRILALAKNFERLYPSFENLRRFNGFALENDELSREGLSEKALGIL